MRLAKLTGVWVVPHFAAVVLGVFAGCTGGGAGDGAGAGADAGGQTGAGGQTAGDGQASGGHGGGWPPLETASKVDLLFVVDNSASMADKQQAFADTVPDFVRRLVNPPCVDAVTGLPGTTPADPSVSCATGYVREFTPVRDIHIGVISSSLGGFGGPKCSNDEATLRGEEENDDGHLMGSRPRYLSVAPPGAPMDAAGFLSWNPDQIAGQTLDALNTAFTSMVRLAGEIGCGYEAPLEAMYRFLSDPKPPEAVVLQPCPSGGGDCAVRTGLDQAVLSQRAAFLRPDSALAVVLLSDENDCSMRDEGIWNTPARTNVQMPRGSILCDTNPNDACCYSCGSQPPAGCSDGCSGRTFAAGEDPSNLRCYRQKQRFGVDFLFPTQRYVNMLTQPQICTSVPDLSSGGVCPDADMDGAPDLARNPVFDDLSGQGGAVRAPSLVFFAGIVGVPWQDIARDPSSQTELAYQSSSELSSSGAWPTIVGDLQNPGGPIEPSDPHMVESVSPRAQLAGTAAGFMADPIHGHEWLNSLGAELQYACIFKLAADRVCPDSATLLFDPLNNPPPDCDCRPTPDNKPLCQLVDGSYDYTQRYAKAYPGIRQLQVLEDLGANSIVASICARNLTDTARSDYGYRPALNAVVERMKGVLGN